MPNIRVQLSLRLILRSAAISAFTRVLDALWRCVSKDEAAVKPSPRWRGEGGERATRAGWGAEFGRSCPSPDLASSVDLSRMRGEVQKAHGHALGLLTFFLYAYNPISVLFTRGVIMRRLGGGAGCGARAQVSHPASGTPWVCRPPQL